MYIDFWVSYPIKKKCFVTRHQHFYIGIIMALNSQVCLKNIPLNILSNNVFGKELKMMGVFVRLSPLSTIIQCYNNCQLYVWGTQKRKPLYYCQ